MMFTIKSVILHVNSLRIYTMGHLQSKCTVANNYQYGNLAINTKFWDKVECIFSIMLFHPQLVIHKLRIISRVGYDWCSRFRTRMLNINHHLRSNCALNKEVVIYILQTLTEKCSKHIICNGYISVQPIDMLMLPNYTVKTLGLL